MSKVIRGSDDSVSNVILSFAALVGGAWVVGEILKVFAKEETYYSCPNCRADIKYRESPCHNCNAQLKWPTKQDAATRTP